MTGNGTITASRRLPPCWIGEREAQLAAALARCAAGDRTALRVIYDSEAPRMVGIARRILFRQDLAEEAVHDAFIRIWRGAAGFDPRRGSARGWLYAVVRNRALSIHRNEHRYEASDESVQDVDCEATLSRMPETSALRRCLEQIDRPRRDVGGAGLCPRHEPWRTGGTAQGSARHGQKLGTAQPVCVAGVHGMNPHEADNAMAGDYVMGLLDGAEHAAAERRMRNRPIALLRPSARGGNGLRTSISRPRKPHRARRSGSASRTQPKSRRSTPCPRHAPRCVAPRCGTTSGSGAAPASAAPSPRCCLR